MNHKDSDIQLENPNERFSAERSKNVDQLGASSELAELAKRFMVETGPLKYTYNFDWMGRPIIQFPQDIVSAHEIIWRVRPDLIIETGIAHGGSLVLSASMLALLDICDAIGLAKTIDPSRSARKVLGVDIDIRAANRAAIETHPMASRIQMIQGSSVATDVIEQVKSIAGGYGTVLVFLDSNHTHEHVLAELKAYAPLVTPGSYCVVWDTSIEDVPKSLFLDRPWGPGDNPKTAVWEYLKSHPEFEIDRNIQHKLLITVAPDGYLRRIY